MDNLSCTDPQRMKSLDSRPSENPASKMEASQSQTNLTLQNQASNRKACQAAMPRPEYPKLGPDKQDGDARTPKIACHRHRITSP